MQVNKFISGFLSLLFPELCICCDDILGSEESRICTKCMYEIPRTKFHSSIDNPVAKLFWGRVNINQATSFFHFSKGSVYQKLVHDLKYKGDTKIGEIVGKELGYELNRCDLFNYIDYIIPVPLHKKRLRQRGYNQSYYIAKGIATATKSTVKTDFLIRNNYTETQTKKGRFERWTNVENKFQLKNNNELEGKHILLVDDVVTTGATLEACAQTLLQAKDIKVSIATMAFA